MPDNLISLVMSFIGTLFVTIIVYSMIFTAGGQKFLWTAIEPAMTRQWENSSMDGGRIRTEAYDELFEDCKYNGFSAY